MKIIVYGRANQPEYEVVVWKCTRTEKGFICLELSGVKRLDNDRNGR
jgi:hypothetical protein